MQNTNAPHTLSRYEQWLLNRADGQMRIAFREFELALTSGRIALPTATTESPNYAGGVNYCPNSDLKFSKKAIETLGTLPSDTSDENYECYRFYRQQQGSDITEDAAHALKSSSHSMYAANEGANSEIPIWNRVIGQIEHGNSAAPLWDVAVKLYNNDIKPADRWYVSFILGALTDDVVPEDLEMYVGIWHKTASGQGWIEGADFTLTHEIVGIKGTKELNYYVIAQTDAGVTLGSQVLNVIDAPDTFDTETDVPENAENFPRISYAGAAGGGFVRFKVYREDVAAGTIYQIADILNTNELRFDDLGGRVNMMPAGAFPTPDVTKPQAIAFSRSLDVGSHGGTLIVNEFTLQIPAEYNWSETQPMSQYLRFGFTRECSVQRQIRLDRIYLGPTFNRWSDSPFDAAGAIPSTSQTGGTPWGGGGTGPLPPGSGTCLTLDTPVVRINFDDELEMMAYEDIPDGDLLENDADPQVVLQKHIGQAKFLYEMTFDNGVWFRCNRAHRIRINQGGDCRAAKEFNVGDEAWGRIDGKDGFTKLIRKRRLILEEPVKVGTFALRGVRAKGNHFYLAGHSQNGNSIYHHNRKADFPDLI